MRLRDDTLKFIGVVVRRYPRRTALLALSAGVPVLVDRVPLLRQARAAGRASRLLRSVGVQLTSAMGGMKPLRAMGAESYLRPSGTA